MDEKTKKLKSALKSKDTGSSSRISDPRFASFETDPRFKLPSKKHAKVTIDKRFSRMLKDDEFLNSTKVDRYGRKLKSDSSKKALQRLYQQEDEDEDEDEDEGGDGKADEAEVDDDEIVQKELRKAHQKHDPARRGGFSESESDSDSDSDEEEGGVDLPAAGDMQRFQDEQAEVESGEVTKRIAIVNLDWDHIKSTDLLAVFSSFLAPESGRIEKISIYPSEFGKERMQQEELEGPPKALFKDAAQGDDDGDDDSGSEDDEKIKKRLLKEGDDEDFDSDALRKYQLDRLRYYYAVMICSNPAVAKTIYDATDGTEFQSSSNFLDLRFVPDDVTFDDEPRDECMQVPDSYKPVEFVTNALQSSKVKLTWDMHPEEASRKDALKRAFGGSRAEIEENDLRAYLASDTEDEDNEQSDDQAEAGEAEEGQPKLSKKELARKKMREALGLSEEPTKSAKHNPVGGMEITFTPALSETKPKKKDPEEETTLEKYVRKERERKEMKRQKAKAKRDGHESEDSASDEDEEVGDDVETAQADTEKDLGFNDPFFTMEEPSAKTSKTSIRKEERRKKREAKEAVEAAEAAQKAKLIKVMAEDADENQADHLDHFDMNDIIKAEKHQRKKGKGKSKARAMKLAEAAAAGGKLQQEFSMDVQDDRFQAVFENHEFAIDPSNPKFKGTEGMNKLLEEGRKKRRGGDREERKSKKSRR